MSRGATIDLELAWRLARGWYHDRLRPDWQRKTTAEAEAFFAELGLSSDFWRLSASGD